MTIQGRKRKGLASLQNLMSMQNSRRLIKDFTRKLTSTIMKTRTRSRSWCLSPSPIAVPGSSSSTLKGKGDPKKRCRDMKRI